MSVGLSRAHFLRFAPRGHLRRGRRFEEFWKFLVRGLGHRGGT